MFRPLSLDSISEVGSENNAMSYANGRFDRTSSLMHIPMVSSSILINVFHTGCYGSVLVILGHLILLHCLYLFFKDTFLSS